jgi:hypothetical protein
MKPSIILILIFHFSTLMFSQNRVDTSNYYDYYSTKKNLEGDQIKTKWLKEIEVAQIVSEEMEKSGYEWISNFRIVKVDTGQFVVSICYSEKSRFGFAYEGIHGAIMHKKDKYIKSNYKKMTGYDYVEKIVSIDGKSDFIKIKNLPNNLYLIKEDLYWYQESNNKRDNKTLVSKEEIIDILRQDIRYILSSAPKPTQ